MTQRFELTLTVIDLLRSRGPSGKQGEFRSSIASVEACERRRRSNEKKIEREEEEQREVDESTRLTMQAASTDRGLMLSLIVAPPSRRDGQRRLETR